MQGRKVPAAMPPVVNPTADSKIGASKKEVKAMKAQNCILTRNGSIIGFAGRWSMCESVFGGQVRDMASKRDKEIHACFAAAKCNRASDHVSHLWNESLYHLRQT